MKNTLTTIALLFAFGAQARAQSTLHVPGDYSTIAAAVSAAVNGDTVLVAPGTYYQSSVIPFNGKIIEVRSTHGPAVTIVDALGVDRCFRFNGGETRATLLEGFTLRNGQAPTGTGTNGRDGGALLVQNASPTIRDCYVQDGQADYGETGGSPGYRGGHGGGLHINGGSPLVERCRFVRNYAGYGGPGVDGDDGADGFGSQGQDGEDGANGGSGGFGGAIHSTNAATVITDCYFADNRAGHGGTGGDGGDGGDSFFTLAPGGDGGRGGSAGSGGLGAAIFVSSGSATILNCTVVRSSVALRGTRGVGGAGGESVGGSGSTGLLGFVGSDGSYSVSGAIPGIFGSPGATLKVRNTILWNPALFSEIVSNKSVQYTCVRGGYVGTGNVAYDPLVAPLLSKNPGALAAGSPCIDAGNNGAVLSSTTTDLLGRSRFVDERTTPDSGSGTGAIVDMGAIEHAPASVFAYGCGNPSGSLSIVGGEVPATGATITMRLTRPTSLATSGSLPGTVTKSRPALLVGTAPIATGCGQATAGGFLQVDLSQPYSIEWASQNWRGATADIALELPEDPSLSGTSLFVQGAYVRVSRKGGLGAGMALTEALELVLGY